MKLTQLTKSLVALSLSTLVYTGAHATDFSTRDAFDALSPSAKQHLKEAKIDINALLSNDSNDLIVNFNESSHQVDNSDNTGKAVATRRFKAVKESVKSTLNDTTVVRDYYGSSASFYRINSLTDLVSLLNSSDIVSIMSNEKLEPMLNKSLANIHQPEASQRYLQTGSSYSDRHYLKGEGSVIAILDTGLDYKQPDFGNCRYRRNTPSCSVIDVMDFARDRNGSFDTELDDSPSTHGTNVSAIALGVAPDAKIIGLDVFGWAWDPVKQKNVHLAPNSALNGALNWIYNNHKSRNQNGLNIVSLNMSLGGGKKFYATNSMPMLGTLKNIGIGSAVATGNEYYSNGIAWPASERNAIAVGATHDTADRGYRSTYCGNYGYKYGNAVDDVTCYSNSSELLDILAPGHNITAGGVTISGTSMATPHIAGALAVFRSPAMLNFRDDSVDDTLNRLKEGGVPVTDFRNGIVRPRLDLHGSVSTYK